MRRRYRKDRIFETLQELLKKQEEVGEKVTLARLKNRDNDPMELDDEAYTRIERLRKFANKDSSGTTQKLNAYYCALCGRIAFVTNVWLEHRPRRLTDRAISLELRGNYIKLSLERDKVKYIRRQGGIETQYRWKCECGVCIGYTGITYDEFDQVRADEKTKVSNRTYFYIFDGAVVEKFLQSKLVSELITFKERVLLHLKRTNKK